MDQLALFDYAHLDVETRDVVAAHTAAIHQRIRRSAQDIIEIGEHLEAVKQQIGHGQFLAWLGQEFHWSERTAQNFMQVADCFKSANFADLPQPSVLYALAAPSTPETVRDEVLERTAAGEHLSIAEARTLIAEARAAGQEILDSCDDCGAPCEEPALVGADPLCDPCAEARYAQAPGVPWPALERESPAEAAYHALSLITVYPGRHDPEDVAAACPDAEGAAYRFRALVPWLETIARLLEDAARRPVRSVQ